MSKHPQFRAYMALIAVYFFWGTTYLAIRIALESFSPLILIAGRFLLSGLIMVIAAKAMKIALPSGRELWLTALYGVIVLGGGNGCLVFAEQSVPSGLAALLLVTAPFWMVGLSAAFPGGERIHLPTLGGILVGFSGVVLLFAPGGTETTIDKGLVAGFLILQFGCFLWCLGALLQKRQPTKAHPVVSGAIQQLATGLAFCVPALLIPHPPVHWSAKGVWAALWLVFFGSIVGYSAFIYAMETLPVAIVSTYNYVNPIVALCLGWLVYGEHFGAREAAAMVIIFLGVTIVKWTTRPKPEAIPSPEPLPPELHRRRRSGSS